MLLGGGPCNQWLVMKGGAVLLGGRSLQSVASNEWEGDTKYSQWGKDTLQSINMGQRVRPYY